jgi:hypothetical protein
MRRVVTALACAALLAGTAAPAAAWSFEVHRFITDRAIALLPPEIRPFYDKHRTFVVEHSVDPDLWRSAGFEEEPPRHYVDLDAFGAWPFKALPRDYDLAVAKFGRKKVDENGTLPWRVAELHQKLVKSFTDHGTQGRPYALENAKFFSAVLAHYVGDAHVPFHAALNYDGQLTNQHGIHSRFESELFARYGERLQLTPTRIAPVRAPVDFIFDTLIDGFTHVDGLLGADLRAIGSGEAYDDAYFDRFFRDAAPVLERQLSRAIAGVAAVITGAWEAAGRPDLPLEAPRTVRTKRPSTAR